MKKPRFTLEEREKVVAEAISLIKEPANWTTGQWKCDVYETDKKGNVLKDEDGEPIRARDHFNRPLAQYCIQGAVNQATYNVLGERRAMALGAWSGETVEEDGVMTELLGIDDLARELYPEITDDDESSAMTVNDHFASNPAEGHKTILGLLNTTLDRIRSKRKEKAAV